MNAYSYCNQIPTYEPDQDHISFIIDKGLYCYIGMPFGLVNAGVTYQRLRNHFELCEFDPYIYGYVGTLRKDWIFAHSSNL